MAAGEGRGEREGLFKLGTPPVSHLKLPCYWCYGLLPGAARRCTAGREGGANSDTKNTALDTTRTRLAPETHSAILRTEQAEAKECLQAGSAGSKAGSPAGSHDFRDVIDPPVMTTKMNLRRREGS